MKLRDANAYTISTHAPAGGATGTRGPTLGVGRISTHAPAGGATLSYCGLSDHGSVISTHAPAGGATRAIPPRKRRARHISTHAPAGGATLEFRPRFGVSTDFYSRPCGRGDMGDARQGAARGNFYSRPCGRGDCNFPQVRHEVLRQIAER